MENMNSSHNLQLQHPVSHQQNNPNQTCLTDSTGAHRQRKPSNSFAVKETLHYVSLEHEGVSSQRSAPPALAQEHWWDRAVPSPALWEPLWCCQGNSKGFPTAAIILLALVAQEIPSSCVKEHLRNSYYPQPLSDICNTPSGTCCGASLFLP